MLWDKILGACLTMKDICLCSDCYINIPNGLFFLLARIIAVVVRKSADLPVAQMSHSSVVLLPCTGWRCLACLTSSQQLWTFSAFQLWQFSLSSLVSLTSLFKPPQHDKAVHSLVWLHWADRWIVHLYVTGGSESLWVRGLCSACGSCSALRV